MSGGLSVASQAAPVSFEQVNARNADGTVATEGQQLPPPGVSFVSDIRTIGLRSLNTGERVDTTFWRNGRYDQSALAMLNIVMRDSRNNQITAMDPALFDLIWNLGQLIGQDPEMTVICGYRSQATNNALIASGHNGVARHSLHVQGKAADIRVPGCSVETLRDAALALHAGGVGYYPRSEFVHVDTGPVRSWNG